MRMVSVQVPASLENLALELKQRGKLLEAERADFG